MDFLIRGHFFHESFASALTFIKKMLVGGVDFQEKLVGRGLSKNRGTLRFCWSEGGVTGAQRSPSPERDTFVPARGRGWSEPELSLRACVRACVRVSVRPDD